MQKIILEPNQSKDYFTLEDVMDDYGFEKVEEFRAFENVYAKNDKYYEVIDWLFINTLWYEIKLLEVDEVTEFEGWKHKKSKKN